MLRLRLATAAVAIPLLLLLIFKAPGWVFAVVVGALAVLAVAEYCIMVFAERPVERALFIVFGAIVAAGTASRVGQLFAASLTVFLVGGLIWVLLGRADFEQGLTDFGRAMIGILYAAYLLPHFVWLHGLPDGPYWVVFVIMTAMMGDTAGYFAGRSLGRHKLAPRVSPSKTVKGAIAIVAASLLAGVATKLVLLPKLGWEDVLLLAAVQGVLGQVGDLCESIMKRTFGTKDSGWLLPGHGGVLDRIDSLVFPVAAMYYYVAFCG